MQISRVRTVFRMRTAGVAVLLACAFGVSLTTPFIYQVVPAYLPMLDGPVIA